ncbi:MAG: SIR2 family protein [Alphaproteobacteria bacterium]
MQLSPDTVSGLEDLADDLLRREHKKDHQSVIVPIVGAGGSKSAGLPLGDELKVAILNHCCREVTYASSLRAYAQEEFPIHRNDDLDRLSLAELCSVIGRDGWGRQQIKAILHQELSKATSRPISYELIAHLAKHRFIDHVFSVNYDRLLDDALHDELDRLTTITSPADIPGSHSALADAISKDGCYFVKPFGSLENDTFAVTPRELQQYGPTSIWNFCQEKVFLSDSLRPLIVLILLGYSGQEGAFTQLLDSLIAYKRTIHVYAIDNSPVLSQSLRTLAHRHEQWVLDGKLRLKHIQLDADSALSVTLEKMRTKGRGDIWAPVARHHLITTLLNNEQLNDTRNTRFEIEIVLQAIKSRGFFTLEGVGDIERIRYYAVNAGVRLDSLCQREILKRWPLDAGGEVPAMQDYTLANSDKEKLARDWIGIAGKDAEEQVEDFGVLPDVRGLLNIRRKPLLQFVIEKIEDIVRGPDIELLPRTAGETALRFDGVPIGSFQTLAEDTIKILTLSLRPSRDHVHFFGIWSTGEWLLHSKGWAYKDFGQVLLQKLRAREITLHLVLCDEAGLSKPQFERLYQVVAELAEIDPNGLNHKIYPLQWWKLNRRLTMVKREEEGLALYFRRRLFTPLVSPIMLNTTKDIDEAERVFNYYRKKASGTTEQMAQIDQDTWGRLREREFQPDPRTI